jgi:anti-sigma factor RsiW
VVDMPGDGANGEPRAASPDGALWRRSLAIDVAGDEDEHFLDLAGYAEDRLDPDERDRIAERLAKNPLAAADVAAARAFARSGSPGEAAPSQIVARACALVADGMPLSGRIIQFPQFLRPQPTLHGVARWAGLAAAVVVASWLGFALGGDASAIFSPVSQAGEDSLLRDLLDPSTAFLRDLTGGVQT